MTETALYKHFTSLDELIYVGVTGDVSVRTNQHRKSHWFRTVSRIDISYFDTFELAVEEERRIIRLQMPKYNIMFNPSHPTIRLQDSRERFMITPDDRETIAQHLRESSIADVSKSTGITRGVLRAIMAGDIAFPSLKTTQKLFSFFNEAKP